jgi:hypothetical protein
LDVFWDIKHTIEDGEKTERIHIYQGTFFRIIPGGKQSGGIKIVNHGKYSSSSETILVIGRLKNNPTFTSIFRYFDEDKLILQSYETGTKIIRMDKYVRGVEKPE